MPMCISWIILYYSYISYIYITMILYLFAGGYKCRLTTFPTRFAHDVSIMSLHAIVTALLWCK